MKLSVIIPIYNTQIDYVNECLLSVANSDYEIIVIDDGSTIDYSKIISKYNNIRYIKTINKGVSSARNLGIKLANGKYITFLDADDKIIQNGINEILLQNLSADIILSRNLIQEHNSLISNYCFYDESFKVVDKSELIKSILLLNQKFTCVDTVWAKLYKKSFLQEYGIKFNSKIKNGEDILFNYECYNKTDDIYFFNEHTYLYRVNPYSVCHTFIPDLDERFILFLNELNILIQRNNITENLYKEHVFRVVCRLFRKYYSYFNYEEFVNKIKYLLNESIIENINEIDTANLNNDKKELIRQLKNKNISELYKISQSAHQLNLK